MMKLLALLIGLSLIAGEARAFQPCMGMMELENSLTMRAAQKMPQTVTDVAGWKTARAAEAARGQDIHARRMACEAAAAKARQR
jgi:hypothetical protein